jgi:hypothetical protein
MDLAVGRVDLYYLAGVAGLAVLLQLAEEVALADFQRCVEVAESAVPQRFVEEARLDAPAMVAEFPLAERSWTPQSLHNTPEGILD